MSKTIIPYPELTDKDKTEQVALMFDNISKRYDFLNRILSLGIDTIWRKKAIDLLKKSKPQNILDVATGTCDFALEAQKRLNPEKIIGIDISAGMLELGQEKINKKNLKAQIELVLGDSENLPFETNTFDAATVAFGVRNFSNLEKGLTEIYRVLNPDGSLVILEFSKPKSFPIKQLYGFYFRYVLPLVGKLFSKDNRAYTYLPQSVAVFPEGKSFLELLEKIGFKQTTEKRLTFGICSIYHGKKLAS